MKNISIVLTITLAMAMLAGCGSKSSDAPTAPVSDPTPVVEPVKTPPTLSPSSVPAPPESPIVPPVADPPISDPPVAPVNPPVVDPPVTIPIVPDPPVVPIVNPVVGKTATLTIQNQSADATVLGFVDSQPQILVCFADVADTLTISNKSASPDVFTSAILTTSTTVNPADYASIAYVSGVSANSCITINSAIAWSNSFPINSTMSLNVSGLNSATISGAWFVTPTKSTGKKARAMADLSPNSVQPTAFMTVSNYFTITATIGASSNQNILRLF